MSIGVDTHFILAHTLNSNSPKKCPSMPPATYSVSNLAMDFRKSIPSIVDGEFRITISSDSNNAGYLACLHVGVNLNG